MVYFIDTSALIKQYVDEPGSDVVREAFRRQEGNLSTSELVLLEASSALTKMRRAQAITGSAYVEARANLLRDLHPRLLVVPAAEDAFDGVVEMIHTFRDRSVGCNDLLHLLAAERLQVADPEARVTFICADGPLGTLAAERGFPVLDPESDSV